jgi:hypothetical protein
LQSSRAYDYDAYCAKCELSGLLNDVSSDWVSFSELDGKGVSLATHSPHRMGNLLSPLSTWQAGRSRIPVFEDWLEALLIYPHQILLLRLLRSINVSVC